MAEAKKNTATIKIEKDNATHRGVVRGAHNGKKFELPVGKEIEVTEGQLNALRDSRVDFTTVSPLAGEDADEGSSASSTVTGTAFRAETNDEENKALDSGDAELSQRTDEQLRTDSQEAAAEAAGEGNTTPSPSPSPSPTPTASKGKASAKKTAGKKPAAKTAAKK